MKHTELIQFGQQLAFGSIPIADIKFVVNRALYYSDIKAGEASYHRTSMWRDYEGSFEQYHSIEDGLNDTSPTWVISATYKGRTRDVPCDFVEEGSLDRNTAHKMRLSGPKETIRFNLNSIRFGPSRDHAKSDEALSDETRDRINQNVARLKRFYVDIDTSIETLESWSQSALSMTVRCISGKCGYNDAIMSSKRMKHFLSLGHTLESLKNKLICSKCHGRQVRIIASDS